MFLKRSTASCPVAYRRKFISTTELNYSQKLILISTSQFYLTKYRKESLKIITNQPSINNLWKLKGPKVTGGHIILFLITDYNIALKAFFKRKLPMLVSCKIRTNNVQAILS